MINERLSIFLWNDDPTRLRVWEENIKSERFTTYTSTSGLHVDQVMEVFKGANPDLVILDIVDQNSGRPLGLEIARAIRQRDLLVPMVAVSIAPDEVYKTSGDILESGFVEVLHEKAVGRETFPDMCVRKALSRWHSVSLDYVLVRKACSALRSEIKGPGLEFASELAHALEALPFLGSMERWHRHTCEHVLRALKNAGFIYVAKKFEAIAMAFQTGDAFYMAGSNSRMHLSHNVQVFMLGIVLLFSYGPLRSAAVQDLAKNAGGNEEQALIDVLAVWCSIALTHDAAYVSERASDIIKKLYGAINTFAPTLERPPLESEVAWPTIHHSEVGSRMWLNDLPSDREALLCQRVAAGILRHDSSRGLPPVKIAEWPQFTAVLCDELQDWGRMRRDGAPTNSAKTGIPWDGFYLEQMFVDSNPNHPNNFTLDLQFAVRDFPKPIRDEQGTASAGEVRDRLETTIGVLHKNLHSGPSKLDIVLGVDFWNRKVPKAVFKGIIQRD